MVKTYLGPQNGDKDVLLVPHIVTGGRIASLEP